MERCPDDSFTYQQCLDYAMDKAEFQKFTGDFTVLGCTNILATLEATGLFSEDKTKDVIELIKNRTHEPLNILDFGVSIRRPEPHFSPFFP